MEEEIVLSSTKVGDLTVNDTIATAANITTFVDEKISKIDIDPLKQFELVSIGGTYVDGTPITDDFVLLKRKQTPATEA